MPSDPQCPILWLQTIIQLIRDYIFSRKHSQDLKIQKSSLKKTKNNQKLDLYMDWCGYEKCDAYQQIINIALL